MTNVTLNSQPIQVTVTEETIRVEVSAAPGARGATGDTGDTGPTGPTLWSGITDKPAVIAAGATQSEARGAIGAGTSSLVLGTGPSEAKQGDWVPDVTDITGGGDAGRDVFGCESSQDILDLLDVAALLANLVDAAPSTLDTLNELAAALGDDPNFATTITTALGGKEPTVSAGTTGQYYRGDKTWQTLDKSAVGLGSLSSCSGLPVSGITSSTSTALGVGSLELAHASDTTLGRTSAGVANVEGFDIITKSVISLTSTATLAAVAGREYTYYLGSGAVPTLPTAASNTSTYKIKNTHTAAISLATTSSQTIDGGAGPLVILPKESYTLESDGSNWQII